MRPVRPMPIAALIAAALVVAIASYVVIRATYGSLPPVPYTPSLTLLVIAVLEGLLARSVRARIHRRPSTTPLHPLQAARLLAVAKATAVVGTVLVGIYLGLFGYTFSSRNTLAAAGNDVHPALAGVIAAAMLVAAALWLEHSCRTPEQPDDKPDEDRSDRGVL